MAKIKSLFDVPVGSIGGYTFSNTLGGMSVKRKVKEPRNPKTPKQMEQRNKHSATVRLSKPINSVLKVTLRQQAIRMSPYNVFYKHNVGKMDANTGTVAVTEKENLVFALGSNEGIKNLTVIPVMGEKIGVDVKFDSTGYLQDTNLSSVLYYMIYNQARDVIYAGGGKDKISDGRMIVVDVGEPTEIVNVYVCAVNPDNGTTSASQYVGELTLKA